MKSANFVFSAILTAAILFSGNLHSRQSQTKKYAGYPFCTDVIENYRLKALERLEAIIPQYTENVNKYLDNKLDSISTTDAEMKRLLSHIDVMFEPRVEMLSDKEKTAGSFKGSAFNADTEVLRLEIKDVKKDDRSYSTPKSEFIPVNAAMIDKDIDSGNFSSRPVKISKLTEGNIILASTMGAINDDPAYIKDCWASLPAEPEITYYNQWKHYSLLKVVFETFIEDPSLRKRYEVITTPYQMFAIKGKNKKWDFEMTNVLFPTDNLTLVEFRDDLALAYTGMDEFGTVKNPVVIRALEYLKPRGNAQVYKLSKLNFNYYVLAPMQTKKEEKNPERVRVLVENDLNG